MRATDPLNDRQLAVLQWIADGCPNGVYGGHSHKTTARALQDRRLVTVSKAAGGWRASLTARGRHYLAHGVFPDEPSVRRPRQRRSPAAQVGARREPSSSGRDQPAPAPAASLSDLLARLQDGADVVTIPDPPPEVRAAWHRAIDAARRSGRIPDGKHLHHRGRDRGDLVIELRDGAHPDRAAAAARPPSLAVPDTLAEPHLLLATLDEPAAVLGVSEAAAPRAIRLLHVLLTEAERQGCEVGWAAEPKRGLEFRTDGQHVGLTISEEWEKRDVLPSAAELAGGKTYAWQRVQAEKREVPTGRLLIELDDEWAFRGRRRRWADRQRWRLEDKLGEILAEILERQRQLQERQLAKDREAAQRQRDWQQAMAAAKAAFQQSRRIAALDAQLADWDKANRIRAYCDALTAADTSPNADRQAWIAWARQYADELDPRGRPDLTPPAVYPKPEDLRPFLNGWSPYGPERR